MRRNHNGLACQNYLRGLLLRANRGQPAGCGGDQRRISEALTRAIAFDMIGEEEWKKCREAAKGLRKGTGVTFDEEDTPDF